MEPSWSESGDRYILKLFRDYLFHQTSENGQPWIDMGHIVQCLNKVCRNTNRENLLQCMVIKSGMIYCVLMQDLSYLMLH